MKFRADIFECVAEESDLMQIQEQAQQYKDYLDKKKDIYEKSEAMLMLYLQASYDEGYRKALKELKQDQLDLNLFKTIEIKPYKYGVFEYIENENNIEDILSLVKRRIRSKRQIKKHKDFKKDEYSYENFVLSMVMHTGFEQGYCKANSLEEIAKNSAANPEIAKMTVDLFNEILEGL